MSDFTAVPPYANRGVQNTLQGGLTACVDWLQVTFKNVTNPQNVIDLLGMKHVDFIPFENGKYGYPYHLRFGHISIYYSEELGHCHLEMSGQGCREFEEVAKYDWSTFIGLVLMLDVNIPRLDLAIDDTKGYFTFKTIKRKIYRAELRSKFHKARIIEEFKIDTGENLGTTCYFGSPKSDIQIRMYDKYKQLLNLGRPIPEGIDKWIRTELQLRDDRAYMAAKIIAENEESNLGQQIKGHLKNYIMFVEKSADSNKGRWKISNFWNKFLEDVDKLPLAQKAPDSSIERTKNWLEHSVSANFATVLEAYDFNADLLADFLIKGLQKKKKKHENMLVRFNRSNSLSDIDIMEKRDNLISDLLFLKDKNKKESEQKPELPNQ